MGDHCSETELQALRLNGKGIDVTLPLALSGKRFLVTRAQSQAQEFVRLLEDNGAEAVCVPTIEIVPPSSWESLDLATRNLDDFDIVIFTSVNGVDAFFERLLENNQYYGVLTDITIVAVGPKTAEALKRNFTKPDLMPEDHRAEGLVDVILQQGVQGKKILYPRAEVVRPLLVESLTNAGAEVVAPVAYRTVMPEDNAEQIRGLLLKGKLDAVCFSSSSTFKNLISMLGDDSKQLLKRTRLFSIGPQTSETIVQLGFSVDLEPQQWTLASLVQAMIEYYQQ
jgi:uroporphyrinogen-III synthase